MLKISRKTNIILTDLSSWVLITARFPSGQRGRTVNPLAQPSQVQILLSPPKPTAGIAQLARATAFQAVGCGFESRFPLQLFGHRSWVIIMLV